MDIQRPRIREDLIFRDVDEDHVVYDPVNDRTLLLNLTAAVIVELCDGSRTVDDIVAEVAAAFDQNADAIRADVGKTLQMLRRDGFFCEDER